MYRTLLGDDGNLPIPASARLYGFKVYVPCFTSKQPESMHPLVGVMGCSMPPRTRESYLPPAAPAESPQKSQSAQPKLAVE
jgi:hypothetical protein